MKRPNALVRSEDELPPGYRGIDQTVLKSQVFAGAWLAGVVFELLVAAPGIMDAIFYMMGLAALGNVMVPLMRNVEVWKFNQQIRKEL